MILYNTSACVMIRLLSRLISNIPEPDENESEPQTSEEIALWAALRMRSNIINILTKRLLVTRPFSWVISALWAVGFALYRMYTFKKEIEHYASIVTDEGDLTSKEYRILIPYTPENPDRLINYAIRIAKENEGEVNVLRVLTVLDQTPLSAGIAFADAVSRSSASCEACQKNT
jgi:hypothetical protein